MSARLFTAATLYSLGAALSPVSAQTSWTALGPEKGGCQLSYQLAKGSVQAGRTRFWLQQSCNRPVTRSIDGRSVTYNKAQFRIYAACNTENYWMELQVFLDAAGKEVFSQSSKFGGIEIDGPEMERQRLYTIVARPGEPIREVVDMSCR